MTASEGKKRRAPTRRSRRSTRAVFEALNRNTLAGPVAPAIQQAST